VTGPQLLDAASHGDTSTVGTLLSEEGAQSLINYQDANGTTPLYMAARSGHAPVTELLIAARCDVDLHDTDGFSPIHRAAFEGHEAVFRLIIAIEGTLQR
jgi:ankyrin repeat protein